MSLKIIVAIARNGVIGAEGGMPWHIPEDLQYFKRTTTGHALFLITKLNLHIWLEYRSNSIFHYVLLWPVKDVTSWGIKSYFLC